MTANPQVTGRKPLLTRKQLAEHLRANGFPIGNSTLVKICSPAINEGPPVAAWWGRRPLYDFDEALAWAEARLRPTAPNDHPVSTVRRLVPGSRT